VRTEELVKRNKKLEVRIEELEVRNKKLVKSNQEFQFQLDLVKSGPYLAELIHKIFQLLVSSIKLPDRNSFYTDLSIFIGDVGRHKISNDKLLQSAMDLTKNSRELCMQYLTCLYNFKQTRNIAQHPTLYRKTCREVISKCFMTGTTEFTAFDCFLEKLTMDESEIVFELDFSK
jgi:hypothetical protein